MSSAIECKKIDIHIFKCNTFLNKKKSKTKNKCIINHFGAFARVFNTHSNLLASCIAYLKQCLYSLKKRFLYQTVSDIITFFFILFCFCLLTS